jgi:hypothetical protein
MSLILLNANLLFSVIGVLREWGDKPGDADEILKKV